jgi:serine/threonine protein kinase
MVLSGAYQLVGRIGEGGMGAVYEAHHIRLRKRVAVKVLNRGMAKHPEAVARFHREASVASRLGHPNLVNVIDFGTSPDGEPYIVMEHLEGEDLDKRIRRTRRIPRTNAVQIARQVASALAVVHAKGIVHRDLKPANIFLVQVPGEPDFVKVLDFGVSKIKAARTKLTNERAIIGTPEYMSPEQVSGSPDEVDHRADQWALACIVWEMLSGRAPFSADNTDALFFQLTNLAPEPLSERAPDLPSGIETVLLRALSKRPSDRYPSVKEFTRALETAALGSWTEITPMPFLVGPSTRATEVSKLHLITESDKIEPLDEVDSDAIVRSPRWRRLRPRVALAGIAMALVIAATGLLFAKTPSGAPSTSPAQTASVARPLVEPKVAVPVAAAAPSAMAEAKRPEPDKNKNVKSQARASKKHGRGLAREVASPNGKRHIFEEL